MARDDDRHDQGSLHQRDGVRRSGDLTPAVGVEATLAQDAHDEPLFGDQWHLGSPGGFDINIGNVWDDYTGAGISVAVIDTGIDPTHPDLDDNIDPDHHLNSKTGASGATSGNPQNGGDNHGTAVAGVIAAEDNDIGVVGVAYGATLVPIYTPLTTSAFAQQGLLYAQHFDVVNNSWGYGGSGDPFYVDFTDTVKRSGEDASFSAYGTAIRNLAEDGRDGLGTIVVFAAGNHYEIGDDVNLSNFTNSRYTIAVGATDEDGHAAFFSTPGSALLISAPGVDIATTDRPGSAGFVPSQDPATLGSNDYVQIDGTSFSAPIISAVSALMLQANSGLGARDLQEILAYSARTIDPESPNWQTNGAGNWNGGGLTWSYDHGSGLVDAHAAVRLAETWYLHELFGIGDDTAATFRNEATTSAATGSPGSLSLTIPDNDEAGVSTSLTLDDDVVIDHIEARLNIIHNWAGDLVAELVSPSGMSAYLLLRPYLGQANGSASFTFSSTFFWGEHSAGDWTLKLYDLAAQDEGRLFNWTITAYGDAIPVDDTYYYTNAYGGAFVDQDAERRTLTDSGGNDTINFAAVESDSTVDLAAGNADIAGRALTIAPGTVIENVIAGDGDDTLTGGATRNMLHGGRGDDILEGGGGDDLLIGGAGSDLLDGGDGNDTASFVGAGAGVTVDLAEGGFQTTGSATGIDRLISIEAVVGSDHGDLLLAAGTGSTLSGGGGDDSLVGRGGNDRLEGGDGVDMLSGGAGDDLLVGDGLDHFDGGDGFDRLRWAGDTLADLRGAGTLDAVDVEIVDFGAADGDVVVLDRTAAAGLTGSGQVGIMGDGNDTLVLEGAWQDQGLVTVDGVSWQSLVLDDVALLVAPEIERLIVDSFAITRAGEGERLPERMLIRDLEPEQGGLLFTQGATFPREISAGGDFNGDGRDDFFLQLENGSFMVLGGADLPDVPGALGALNGTNGFRLSGDGGKNYVEGGFLGDINGDGFDDFAWTSYNGKASVKVVFGNDGPFASFYPSSGDSMLGDFAMTSSDAGAYSLFYGHFSSAGDVNGDGFDDFIIGVKNADVAGANSGLAYIVFGHDGPWDDFNLADLDGSDGFRVTGSTAFQVLGSDVTTLGDINNDGFDDILLSSPPDGVHTNGFNGNAYVILGKAGGFAASISVGALNGANGFQIQGPKDGAQFTTSASPIGDFNGDGIDDFLLSATRISLTSGSDSEAYVVYGREGENFAALFDINTLDGSNGFKITRTDNLAAFGSVSGLGDFNGDGYADIAIGAAEDSYRGYKHGAVHVLYGRAGNGPAEIEVSDLDPIYGSTLLGDVSGENMGQLVSGIGDYNGDGAPDLLVTNGTSGSSAFQVRVVWGTPAPDPGEGLVFREGGAGNDAIQGSADDDMLSGKGGDDTLNGGADGADILAGGGGSDTLLGLAGNDTLLGGSGNDRLEGGTGNDTLSDGDGNDLLDGGDGDDVMVVHGALVASLAEATASVKPSGLAVTVSGGSGEDSATIVAYDVADTISATAVGGNIVVVDENLNTVTLDHVETLVIEALAGDDIVDLGSLVTTSLLRARVLGGAGNDVIDAAVMGRSVTLEGGAGNDTLAGSGGDDVLDGGDGEDEADYSGATSRVFVDLWNTDYQSVGAGLGLDRLVGIETLRGSSFDDSLTGSDADDLLIGGDGDDKLKGHGGNDRLEGGDGADLLRGGTGDDTLVGGAGDDLLLGEEGIDEADYSHASGEVHVDLGLDFEQTIGADEGRDRLLDVENVRGSAFGDRLEGSELDNVLTGQAGDDLLQGKGGDDVLIGGADEDKLFGGNGNDLLRGGSGRDALDGGGGVDTVDYGEASGGVTVELRLSGYQEIGADQAQDELVGIENVIGSSHDDGLIGDQVANVLSGGAGNDILKGLSGDDTLIGGDGDDALFGGEGMDTFEGGAGDDAMVGHGEIDTVDYGRAGGGITVDLRSEDYQEIGADQGLDLLRDIENVRGGAFADHITGNAVDNELTGGAGNDTLLGLSGNDTLLGGAGDDRLEGGAGNDALSDGDGSDVLDGGDGDDVLVVRGALVAGVAEGPGEAKPSGLAVTVSGGAGTDTGTIAAYDLDDTITVSAIAGGLIQTVDENLNTVTVGDVETIVFDGLAGDDVMHFGAITGGALQHVRVLGGIGNDVIDAAAIGMVATLEGGSGNDTLSGGSGDDVLDGGDGLDEADYSGATSGVWVDLWNADYQSVGAGLGLDRLVGIESVRGTSFVDTLTGSEAGDRLLGGAGDDKLKGHDGNDRLEGGDGADLLRGGTGDDTLVGGAGDDLLLGEDGIDEVDYGAASGGVRVDLGRSSVQAIGGGEGSDRLLDVENVRGSAFSDRLDGSELDNVLTGQAGEDVLLGRGGDDVLIGGSENDTLSGGSGNDVLRGGAGRDALNGGEGIDTADYGDASGGVTVELRLRGYQEIGADQAQDNLVDVENLTGSSHDDWLIGDQGINALSGGAGNDILKGLSGDDTLIGGDGDDGLFGGAGMDTFEGGAGDDAMVGHGDVDTVDYGSAGGGVTVDLRTEDYQEIGADQGRDLLRDIENVRGSAFADDLIGNAIANELAGGAGDDTLSGEGGNDVLRGGGGRDLLVGGGGVDTVDYGEASGGVTVELRLSGYQEIGADQAQDELVGIENVTGSSHDDGLIGDQVANVLSGGAGNDILKGLSGDDTLIGGDGDDALFGGEGMDTFEGGAGDDAMVGHGEIDTVDYGRAGGAITVDLRSEDYQEIGADQGHDLLRDIENVRGGAFADHITGNAVDNELTGGAGNDTLSGGEGSDSFVFRSGDGFDRIEDFSAADRIVLAVSGIDSFADVLAAGDDQGGTADVVLDFGSGDGMLLVGVHLADLDEAQFAF